MVANEQMCVSSVVPILPTPQLIAQMFALGQKQTSDAVSAMSGLPLKADFQPYSPDVR